MNEESENFSATENNLEKNVSGQSENTSDSISKKESWIDILKFVLITAAIVLPIRLFIAQPFLVSGPSMQPLFNDRDYLIVDEISYRFEEPKRGEVIVFKFPEENKYLIKRIVGLPGETITLSGKEITITNTENPSGLKLDESYITDKTDEPSKTITLDKNHYYVLGDNRPVSYDSRYWGPLEAKNIVGRPLIRLYPFNKMAVFPGRQND